ncbi:MAG: hypothetical protein AB4041_01295 [Microcystaceae cyanobacterium]
MANLPEQPPQEPTLTDVLKRIEELSNEMKQFDQRFADYRQATQWVVQLAFTLIASATITVILTSVLK